MTSYEINGTKRIVFIYLFVIQFWKNASQMKVS